MFPPLRRSLLSLPPSLRTTLYQRHLQQQSQSQSQWQLQQTRSFSASSPRKSPVVDAILYGPTLLLDTLHTALPWHTAIPLSAIIIRSLLVYHLSALPARKSAIIRTNLSPLSSAKTRSEFNAHRTRIDDARTAAIEAGKPGIPVPLMKLQLAITSQWMALRNSHRVGKAFGAPVWNWWRSPVNLGVLIAMTEAVRVKCGAREGLLSVLAKPFDGAVDPEAARRAAMTGDEILVERLEAAQAAKQAKEGSATTTQAGGMMVEGEGEKMDFLDDAFQESTTSDHLSAVNTNTYANRLDPSLQTEGLAWFPDLTVADSTMMLPLALSTTMALTILLRPKTNPPPVIPKKKNNPTTTSSTKESQSTPKEEEEPLSAVLASLPPAKKSFIESISLGQRLGLSFSILFFFAATKLPAAVLLYLMTSMGFGWLQARWLDMKYPLPEAVRACRRPVRVKVRKEFRDA